MTDSTESATEVAGPLAKMLGPFLGHVTEHSVKVWLHLEGVEQIYVSIYEREPTGEQITTGNLLLQEERLWTDCVTIEGLKPDTLYFYALWKNAACSVPFDLDGLAPNDLHFRTLSADPNEQIDFLMMSCHNPDASKLDGADGYAVWADIPQIVALESNRKVRFALLVGDQVYADEWQTKILAAQTHEERVALYLEVYRHYWAHIHYRRVLCALPAVLIWDDHDITDGWGSTLDSFIGDSDNFKPDWLGLMKAATKSFSVMQASRNPLPLQAGSDAAFDFCFKVGKSGFACLDLRSNRNLRKAQLMTSDQAGRIRNWVDANRDDITTLFIVSPVVFSHGAPVIDDLVVGIWPWLMKAVDIISGWGRWAQGMRTKFGKNLGDIRDDIRDSWGAKENASQADMILDYLYGLQNDPLHPLSVVILSGDIHTSGYSSLYSSDPTHADRPTIPHITSSSVAYTPFNWILEAIYRNAAKTVALGQRGAYSAQVSHHFCSRSVAVLSIRPTQAGQQLKVKYYLEGFPEPQILLFDLDRISHRENISWIAQERLFNKDYAPSIKFDVEADIEARARAFGQPLNWRDSIVDLMKALGMDSSLGARKRLAQQWGYQGTLNGSAEMNIWLHQNLMRRFIAAGGQVPNDQALPN